MNFEDILEKIGLLLVGGGNWNLEMESEYIPMCNTPGFDVFSARVEVHS